MRTSETSGLSLINLLTSIMLVFGLTACGGGESTTENPVTTTSISSNYSGPAPVSADVQSFRLSVWENLNGQNRCGSCHVNGGQSPSFVRMDDINLAYAEANSIANLSNPSNSRMVTKVAGGHNCWLESDSACGDVITAYITAWAGGVSGGGNVIELKAPPLKVPGDSKSFPLDSTLFASTVHPLLTTHCTGCHVDSATNAQSPFFADNDPDKSYEAAKPKIDPDNPANSRFVARLRDEFHNCWSSDCLNDADTMEAAIAAFADQIPLTQIAPQLVTSMALTLPDGLVASGGNRYEENVIALYQFKNGKGNTAFDTSGINPAMHLTLSGNVDWVGGWGIDFISGKAQASTAGSRKLYDQITATGEYSIEAWVVPANVTQEGPARIISYSANTTERNFTLGQTQYSYDFLNRNINTDQNGESSLSTADADEDLQATLQHVVATYEPARGRRLYVNGVFTGDDDPVAGGSLIDWDDSFAFALGNEVFGDRQWQGKLRLVAIHNRALTRAQILQNLAVGVGEKFFLLFNVSNHTGIADSYVMFEVSQFDNFSYLFNQPVFIILDPTVSPGNIAISGMRIGINGKEATVGQAYKHLDTQVRNTRYTAGSGQTLSPLGTIIALEKGSEADEFFLTFELLGNSTNVVLEPAPLQPGAPPDLPEASDIGLRTFEEIATTMSAITTVSRSQAGVKAVYDTVKQQLPTVENLDGFLSAHQMAISQLAIEYCSALVNNQGQTRRSDYFPAFDFNQAADAAFNSAAQRDQIIMPLVNGIMNTGLTTQPDPAAVISELDDLILILTACAFDPSPSCATISRTEEVVKATCAATLGSAAMLIQ